MVNNKIELLPKQQNVQQNCESNSFSHICSTTRIWDQRNTKHHTTFQFITNKFHIDMHWVDSRHESPYQSKWNVVVAAVVIGSGVVIGPVIIDVFLAFELNSVLHYTFPCGSLDLSPAATKVDRVLEFVVSTHIHTYTWISPPNIHTVKVFKCKN